MPRAPVRLTATDAHAAGGVVRLVTGGFPVPRGRTMDDKAKWLVRRHEGLCSALTLEPRGHDGIVLAVLCEPVTSGADAGVLFRHAAGFVPLCGHGLMGAATIAIERRLIVPRKPWSADPRYGRRTRRARVRYASRRGPHPCRPRAVCLPALVRGRGRRRHQGGQARHPCRHRLRRGGVPGDCRQRGCWRAAGANASGGPAAGRARGPRCRRGVDTGRTPRRRRDSRPRGRCVHGTAGERRRTTPVRCRFTPTAPRIAQPQAQPYRRWSRCSMRWASPVQASSPSNRSPGPP